MATLWNILLYAFAAYGLFAAVVTAVLYWPAKGKQGGAYPGF